ncbi:MAG TPA: DUF423 domain-containing protein [Caulobacteraceae bacterium]|nr:DUF423 domain-containing protein [Caulobacteraceae bacterium]
MSSLGRILLALAALAGLGGVAFGAFAAHGLADPAGKELTRTGSAWETSQALAAVAAVVLAELGLRRARLAAPLFLVGVALFSGSLYALALGAPRGVGAVTPLGGLAFIAGWAMLILAAMLGPPKKP